MNKVILFFCLGFYSISIQAQDANSINSDFNSIVSRVTENISSKDGCELMLKKLDDLKSDIEELQKNREELDINEREILSKNLFGTEALTNFIVTVGCANRAARWINEKQMTYIKNIIPFELSELVNYKLCAIVYEVRFGKYRSLIVKKTGDKEIFRISAKLVSNNGMSRTTSEFGLEANQYCRLWNNSENLNGGLSKIISMNCWVGYIKNY